MSTIGKFFVARAVVPALLMWIPLTSIADDPADPAVQHSAEAATAYESLISAQTENLKMAMLNRLNADKYWTETVDGLTLTEQQEAELRALQMLADDRFTPHLAAAELAEGIQAVLTGEQDPRLTARLRTPGRHIGQLAAD